MVPDTLPGVSGANDQLLGDEALHDGFLGGRLGGMPLQRTNSSGSFGLEGPPFLADGAGLNGFHHGYQGAFSSPSPLQG